MDDEEDSYNSSYPEMSKSMDSHSEDEWKVNLLFDSDEHEAMQFDVSSISDELSAFNDRMSSTENGVDSMHHAVRRREYYIGDSQRQQTEPVESNQKYAALLAKCIQLKMEKARIERERTEMEHQNKFMEQSVARMIVENLRLHKKVDALRSEVVRRNERIDELERGDEDQRGPLDGALGPDTGSATKGQRNITWLSGKELVEALQRERVGIWEHFSLQIDSAMSWIRNQ